MIDVHCIYKCIHVHCKDYTCIIHECTQSVCMYVWKDGCIDPDRVSAKEKSKMEIGLKFYIKWAGKAS